MAHQAGAYLAFCNMKRLGVFLLPYVWDASTSPGPNLHKWVERGTLRVKNTALRPFLIRKPIKETYQKRNDDFFLFVIGKNLTEV